ncbi:MAG TPA: plastocyanin/azurin family copper-binding protein [Candidatus Paceibacterota bacterium]
MKTVYAIIIVIIIVGLLWFVFGINENSDNVVPETPISQNGNNAAPEGKAVSFDVTGKNFEFNMKEIKVKEGDTVTINFKSESGFHDFVLDEFNVRTAQLQSGGTESVTFLANKKGTFEYYCSVGSHRSMGMVGKLIVE